MTSFRAGAATDIGQTRAVNQDLYLVADGLYAVADGMGGHNGGEIAARLAVEGLQLYFTRPTMDDLVHALERANDSVITQAKRDEALRGMGTTLSALAGVEVDGVERIAVVNVGDARTYLLQDHGLVQITKDHSLVEMLVDEGTVSRAEAASHPQRNIVTRALGIDEKIMVDSFELLPVRGDRYLICSDGLFNEVPPDAIAATLLHFTNPNEAAHELVHMANEGGGRDNITCIVVDVVDGLDPPASGEAASRLVASTTGQHRVIAEVSKSRPGRAPSRDDDLEQGREADEDGREVEAAEKVARARRIDDLPPPRRVTWRVGVFGGLLVLAVVVAVFAVGFSARNTYYVGFEGEAVAIYRGRPGGVLWIDPTVEEITDIVRADLPERLVNEVEGGKDEDSLDSARDYVAFLETEADDRRTADTDTDVAPSGSSRSQPRGATSSAPEATPGTEPPP
jgi:protein phosphatase